MMIHPDDAGFIYATDAEFDREGAREVGYENQNHAWVLSDRDCWYANPFYTGPKVKHPEDDSDCYEQDDCELAAKAPYVYEDFPF